MKNRLDQLNEQGNEQLLTEYIERSGYESLDDAGAAEFFLGRYGTNYEKRRG